MNDIATVDINDEEKLLTTVGITREELLAVEKEMMADDRFQIGDCFPLTHSFADGLYVREIRVPAGNIVVTKLFKQTHATFLLKGEVFVITETGTNHYVAPCSFITPAGTKRLLYVNEDCIWTTVHGNPTNEKDIDQIEKFVIAESYEELEAPVKPLEIGG